VPPAWKNEPPTIRSAFASTTMLFTIENAGNGGCRMPVPSGDHVVPFQRAMHVAGTPPIAENAPAAITSPFGITRTSNVHPELAPSIDHCVPFQRCTPTELATTRSPPGRTSIDSTGGTYVVPIRDHATPSQRAMLSAGTPPANWNRPPATTSPFASFRTAYAGPLKPLPNGCQPLLVRRAMRFAVTPPIVVKPPPSTASPSDSTIAANTPASMPSPSTDHTLPFQRAACATATPPATVNCPPATTSPLGSAATANTW
jgi:hypothetical protein